MNKWTPGPWQNQSDPPPPKRYAGGISRMAMVRTQRGIRCIDCTGSGKDYQQDVANAALIASAPELYEALQSLVAEYGPQMASMRIDSSRRQFWRDAVAALAKARGETA